MSKLEKQIAQIALENLMELEQYLCDTDMVHHTDGIMSREIMDLIAEDMGQGD